MKLAAIYNVWSDSHELLEGSIAQIRSHVDDLIVICQRASNYGEHDGASFELCQNLLATDKIDALFEFKPSLHSASDNERDKRNIGIVKAYERGNTHYILLDCDEYYNPTEFALMREEVAKSPNKHTLCTMFTYFKEPTLRLKNIEPYYVPFIQPLHANSQVGYLPSKAFRIDPTRAPMGAKSFTQMPYMMHHYSYVRKDIMKKINNSSAKGNILKAKDVLLNDLKEAKDGYYCQFYRDTLIATPNFFNIHI